MQYYHIQNDERRFGFIVEMNIEEHATNFRILKINTEGEGENNQDYYGVELVLDGILKWDGCSNLNFGDNGYIHFCETDDLICMNKSIAFIWEMARKEYNYKEYVDPYDIKVSGIKKYTGRFKVEE